MGNRLVRYLLGAIGLVVLATFLWRADLRSALRVSLRAADLGMLCAAGVLVVANLLVKAWRWKVMARQAGGGARISLAFCLASVVSGVAAASLAPGRLVDAAKPLMLRDRYGAALKPAGSVMLSERLLDLAAVFAVLGACAALFPPGAGLKLHSPRALAAAAAVCAAAVVGLVASGWKLWVTAGRDAGVAGRRPAGWALVVGLSFLAGVIEVVRAWFVYGAVGIHASPVAVGFAFSGAAVAGLASLIPGGVGVVEAAQAYLIGVARASARATSAAAAAALADRLLSYYSLVLAGGLAILWYSARRRGAGADDGNGSETGGGDGGGPGLHEPAQGGVG